MTDKECWHYKGKCMYEPPEGFYGYIYEIQDDQGRFYFGKKAFSHRKKTKLSKKARVGTRKRVKIEQKDSGWLTYFGSCIPLNSYIKERGNTKGFKRTIIGFCKDKNELAYREMELLIKEDVLFRDDCWNQCIPGRKFYKQKK